MFLHAPAFRIALALIIGLWAPLSCCCGTAAAADAAPQPATASCHHDAPAAGSHEQPGHPCDGERDCNCTSHVAQARVCPDKPLTLAGADGPLDLLLDLQTLPLQLLDPPLSVLVLHKTGPPVRHAHSLFALHCMLTI